MGEGVALLFPAPEASLGWDTHYRYRPDPDLFYLTGFAEPDAVAVLEADRRKMTLFVRKKDRERETWEGRRAGPEGAVKEVRRRRGVPGRRTSRSGCPTSSGGPASSGTRSGSTPAADRTVAELLGRFRREARDPRRGPVTVKDPTTILHEMRLFKEPAEIEAMERSAAIAARAHRDAMALAKPGLYEYELEAAIEKRFKKEGALRPFLRLDRGLGRKRHDPPLHGEPPPDGGRRPRPRRRGVRGGRLRVGHHADVSGVGDVLAPAEAGLRRRSRVAARGDRDDPAGRPVRRGAQGGPGSPPRRLPRDGAPPGEAVDASLEERGPAVLPPQRLALARPGRPRPGPVPRREGKGPEARGGDGPDRRAGALREARREGRSEGVPRNRRPHRGRRSRHGRRRADPDRSARRRSREEMLAAMGGRR